MIFSKNDKEYFDSCPWCESKELEEWGHSPELQEYSAARCKLCDLVFIQNRLNDNGLKKLYSSYLSNVHQACKKLNDQRKIMYHLEFDLVKEYLKHHSSILDVGCSAGHFLDIFKRSGQFECFGVEFGEEAAKAASKNYDVKTGVFPTIEFSRQYDLIIFRGVIEHVRAPKQYLEKAVSLLNDNGLIYITSTPNRDSFCCNVFKEKWNQHIPEEHLYHFSVKHFDTFFMQHNLKKIVERYFYEETPYADIEEDILTVARAIKLKKNNKAINFSSPAFYGTMMSLIYQKA